MSAHQTGAPACPAPPEGTAEVSGEGASPGAGHDHGLVLCGGEGRRMGGQDKGSLVVAGRSLAAWSSLQLQAGGVPACQVWLSRHPGMEALTPDVEGAVLLDVRPERCGPLSGLEAALVALASLESSGVRVGALRVLPCDVWPWPHAMADWWARAQACGRPVYLHDAERAHPVVARLPRPASGWQAWQAELACRLDQGQRRLLALWTDWGVTPLAATLTIRNLNTPDDLPA
ncbi:MAG: hypothetical protein E6Q92_06725 [Burkholderiaceae bacterium]|nr:MAG: hypothetical protein E6Q92_06725 [Burkholderiaceae bacterium]